MKKTLRNGIFAIAAAAAAILPGCADLGFGVDVSDTAGPYWYGSPYYPTPSWDGPFWAGPVPPGPALPPPRPPLLNPGIGPAIPNKPSNPGINRVPTQVGGVTRPGNGGLANPTGASSPRTNPR